MKRRWPALAAGALVLAMGGILYSLLDQHHSEVLLAPAATLTPTWTELRPSRIMRTSGDWSELFVEMLNLHEGPDGDYAFDDRSKLSVEAYLLSSSGEKLDLAVDLSVGGFGSTRVLRLSNPALEWKRRNYKFRSLGLRANRPLNLGRIVWISYDPQSTKSGEMEPDVFNKN